MFWCAWNMRIVRQVVDRREGLFVKVNGFLGDRR